MTDGYPRLHSPPIGVDKYGNVHIKIDRTVRSFSSELWQDINFRVRRACDQLAKSTCSKDDADR